jgi:hypothetical protein
MGQHFLSRWSRGIYHLLSFSIRSIRLQESGSAVWQRPAGTMALYRRSRLEPVSDPRVFGPIRNQSPPQGVKRTLLGFRVEPMVRTFWLGAML